MARCAFTVAVSNIRGKAGQALFSNAHNGATLRQRVTPRNPTSAKQGTVRSNLAAGSRAYKALSSTNVAAWQAWALTLTQTNPTTGGTYHPSAIDVFTKYYTLLKLVTPTGTPPSTPPAAAFTGDTQVITVGTVTTTAIPLTGTAASVANTKIQVGYVVLPSANVVPKASAIKNAGFATIPSTPFQISVVPSPSFVTGQILAFYYRSISTVTGQTTPWVFAATKTV